MLEKLRAKLSDLLTQRADEQAAIDAIVTAADAEERSDLSPEEAEKFGAARDSLAAIDTEVTVVRSRIEELEDVEERRAAAAALTITTPEAGMNTPAPIRIGNEPLTYRSGGEHDFVADAFRAQFHNDREAEARIQRNSQEMEVEYRDATTSSFGGMVVPQYMTEEFAAVLRAGRPFLNAVRNVPLPDNGTVFTIPRGTTGTVVTVQVTQGDDANAVDYGVTDLTIYVRTFSGQTVASRQALERGTGVSEILLQDLAADYSQKVNLSALKDAGTSGTLPGVLTQAGAVAVSYTTSTPTVAGVYGKLADAIQQIQTGRYLPPTAIFMHPRRWAMFTAASDTTGRPLVSPVAPQNSPASGSITSVGTLHGLPVITDPSIPITYGASTNEDRIIVARASDILFWESAGAPRELTFEEVKGSKLQVQMVAYGYAAFSAGRYPSGIAVVGGTGLATPTF